MSRKWTNIRFEFDDRNGSVPQASSHPKTQEEVVKGYIVEAWNSENIPENEDNVDFMLGNVSTNHLVKKMTKFFQEFDFINRIFVVHVHDVIGYGYVYEPTDEREAHLVDQYSGVENAMGEDVAEEIYDKYSIAVNPIWLWD